MEEKKKEKEWNELNYQVKSFKEEKKRFKVKNE